MTKNKIFKIIIIFLIIITLIMIFAQSSFALFDISKKFENANDSSEATNKVGDFISATINVLQVFGVGFALLMLVILGIRWIGVSPSGKADIARQSKYYILGVVFIVSGIAILQIIQNFTNKSVVGKI